MNEGIDLLPIQGPSVGWEITDLGDPMVFIKSGSIKIPLCPLQGMELAGTLVQISLEAHEYASDNDCVSRPMESE